ncbi:dihydrofolate reductase [Natronocalculus amylovorans]|uniref:dihydrofolate reductase n=1 Tax=Natronocalculus amylovorans TaxID=2917812 RepID=A0AAE3FVU2_9EURY|nr:dihydrofolate reductase [Natronocalculus amylovorans]MCL9816166.1 dihydrofolate reductase [Natronocalculus amylovorans]
MSNTETQPEIALIAAVAENGVIGADNEMPWHLPEDLTHFKQTTMGHPVIMGRKTYESITSAINGPLPGRTNIVLSRSDPTVHDGVIVVDGISTAIDVAREHDDDRIFVIGGATVYEQFLPHADRLVLTELETAYDGDTTFPTWDHTVWVEADRDDRDGFSFVEYVRKNTET